MVVRSKFDDKRHHFTIQRTSFKRWGNGGVPLAETTTAFPLISQSRLFLAPHAFIAWPGILSRYEAFRQTAVG